MPVCPHGCARDVIPEPVAKVAENNMTVRVDEDALLLYATVNNIVGMNMLDSKKLCCRLE